MPKGKYERKKKIKTQKILTPEPLKSVNFDRFIGLNASLYFSLYSCKFQLGDVLFEVIEDESDAYRSAMKEIRIISQNQERIAGNYLGSVTIQKVNDGYYDGYQLIDNLDKHIWLKFGTSNIDDYYPSFHFYFSPKPSLETEIKAKIF